MSKEKQLTFLNDFISAPASFARQALLNPKYHTGIAYSSAHVIIHSLTNSLNPLRALGHIRPYVLVVSPIENIVAKEGQRKQHT